MFGLSEASTDEAQRPESSVMLRHRVLRSSEERQDSSRLDR